MNLFITNLIIVEFIGNHDEDDASRHNKDRWGQGNNIHNTICGIQAYSNFNHLVKKIQRGQTNESFYLQL